MKKIVLSLIILTAFFANAGFAAPFKIGVIDLQKILQSIPQVKKADNAFKSKFAPREDKIKEAVQELQKNAQDYKRNSAVMSDKQKSEAQDKLVKERNDVQQLQVQFQQDAQAAQASAMQSILGTVKSATSKIAAKNGYSLVIQKSTTVYYQNQYDITDQVISALK